ncbi:hypothetical protein WR25_04956 [Diploscapter pachys]|uniref:Uncharacterized protein n=1 Tax=Diploscapter pachys TaxID=2018661 RepID=A0A2A2JQY0_9BILA|nr:hypothetical protein WR25_04956 [Diploscapter pachys]
MLIVEWLDRLRQRFLRRHTFNTLHQESDVDEPSTSQQPERIKRSQQAERIKMKLELFAHSLRTSKHRLGDLIGREWIVRAPRARSSALFVELAYLVLNYQGGNAILGQDF